jgi:hypothetical protein
VSEVPPARFPPGEKAVKHFALMLRWPVFFLPIVFLDFIRPFFVYMKSER